MFATLLAGIGIKDYVYAGIIAAIVGAFAYYTHHERVIGADEALAPVAVLAQKSELKVAVAAAVAQSTEKDNAQSYTATVSLLPVPVVGLVCHDTGRSDVPPASAVAAADVGEPAAVVPSGPAFDPSGAILKLGADADAEITYLQARVHELESQMESAP